MERKTTLWERAAALLLALFMVFGMIPLQAFAEGETPTVTISGPQEISVDNSSIQLTAEVTGATATGYLWEVTTGDAAAITGDAIDSAVTLTRVPAKNGSVTVQVTVTYLDGEETKTLTGTKEVLVKRNADESVSVTPSGSSTVGTTLTADVSGTDASIATYQWQEKHENDEDYYNISGATGVKGEKYTPTAAGVYRVVATVEGDEAGLVRAQSVSDSVTVRKNNIPDDEISVSLDGLVYGDVLSTSAAKVNITAQVDGTMYISKNRIESAPTEETADIARVTVTTPTDEGYTGTLPVNVKPDLFDVKSIGDKTLYYWFQPTDDAKYYEQAKDFQYNVAQKQISISSITLDGSKTYDGTTDLSVGYSQDASIRATVELNDVVGNDVVQVSGGLEFELADKNAGPTKSVSVTGTPTLAGAKAGNYTLSLDLPPVTSYVEVTPKPISLTDVTIVPKVYDGTNVVSPDSVTYGFDGVIGYDAVSVTGATFVSETKDATTDATTSRVYMNGNPVPVLDNSNYTISDLVGEFNALQPQITIEPLPIKVKPSGQMASKVSDGTMDAPAALRTDRKYYTVEAADGYLIPAGEELSVLPTSIEDWKFAITHRASGSQLQGIERSDFVVYLKTGDTYTKTSNYSIQSIASFYANIDAIRPDTSPLDLTTSGTGTFTLKDGQNSAEDVTVSFVPATGSVPAENGGSDTYWYKNGDTLRLADGSPYTMFDQNHGSLPSLSMTEDTHTSREFYLYNENTGIEYGPVTLRYNYDATAPVITTVHVAEATSRSIDFGQSIVYTVQVSDSGGSGLNEQAIRYCVLAQPYNSDFSGVTWSTPAEITANGDGTYNFKVTAPATGYLYVKAEDYAQNSSTSNATRALVIERTKPTLTVTVNNENNYAQSHQISIYAVDEGTNRSGVSKVTYKLELQGREIVGEADIAANDAPSSLDDIAGKTITLEPDDAWTTPLVQGDKNGDYILTVYAYDFCGNVAEITKTLRLDNTSPEVSLSMSKQAPHNGSYYYDLQDAAVNVTIKDLHLTGGNLNSGSVSSWRLTFEDENSHSVRYPAENVQIGSVTTDAATGLQTFTATVPTNALADLNDGVITVSVEVYDNAGNCVSNINQVDQGMSLNGQTGKASFVLDTRAPELEPVSYGSYTNSEQSGNKTIYYYGLANGIGDPSNLVATFVLNEENFYSSDVEVKLFKGDQEFADPQAWNYSWSGTTLTVTVQGTIGDGAYRVQVAYTDPAGHSMTGENVVAGRYTGEECTNIIDTKRPEATFAVVSDATIFEYEEADYYNKNFTASFTVMDANYDAGKINATYAANGNGSENGTAMTASSGNVYTRTVSEDGFYTFHIDGVDKANNKLSILAGNGTSSNDDFDTHKDEGRFTSHPKARDTVAPVATIGFNSTAEGNHYYSETVDGITVYRAYYGAAQQQIAPTVTVQDANGVDYSRIYRGVNVAEETAMTSLGSDKTIPGSQPTLRNLVDPISQAGDYTFSIYGTDKAGNALTVIEKNKTSDTDDNSDVQVGYGTLANKYTTYPKTLDKSAPTVTLSYTNLDSAHYNGTAAHYNTSFTATYEFADDHGLDLNKLFTQYNSQLANDAVSYQTPNTPACEPVENEVQPNRLDTRTKEYTINAQPDHSTDGNYNFKVYGEDKAGNPLTVTETGTNGQSVTTEGQNQVYTSDYTKVMDTRSPVATLVVTTQASRQDIRNNDRFYLNKDFSAVYTVTELNFAETYTHAKYGLNADATNYETDLVGETNSQMILARNEDAKKYSYALQAATEGIYAFAMDGTDWAGNPIRLDGEPSQSLGSNPIADRNLLQSYVIALDKTRPEMDVQVNDYYRARLTKEQTYVVADNKPYRNETAAKLTMKGEDKSPVQLLYKLYSSKDGQSVDRQDNNSYTYGMTEDKNFTGEQVFAITELVVADLAGNVSTAPANVDGNVSNYIYLDVTPPTEDKLAPTVSLVAHESGQGRSVQGVDLYNSTVTVEAKISDPGFGEGTHGTGGTSSGLFTLHYVVQHNDSENWNAQMEGKVATTSTNHGITTGADGIVYYTESKKGDEYTSIDPGVANEALVGEDTITFTFDAATFNYNDISIRVWAEDNTGHKSGEAIYRFGIDTTAPKIQVTYDNNDARNEKYFKADRTATVVVTERNFDPDNTVITTEVGHSGWSYAAGGLANGDDDTWTCTVPYTEDADYTFNVTAKDLVGHDAGEADYGDSVAPREFTVDKTKPVIEITFDNNDVRNGRYYKENRTATIHIEEHNFAAEDAEVTTTAEIAEGGVAAPAAGSWGSAGDSNTAQVPFNADGDYTMQVKFQDKAGNEAEPKEVELFTVDTTAPELTFSINDEAFEAGSYTPRAYNGQVVPGITYHDINYDGTGTQMSIVGAKNVNSQILSGAPAEDAMGGVYTCENIAETPENDDVYTCTGRVVDMAGNESTVDFLFSVNRYGSNYLLTPDTQALVDNYYTNSAPNLGVSEINVNTLKFEEITYALNGDIRTLQPGTDYQVTESGSETSWKQYDYTIFNSNFDREGVYDITIYSEDEAGNANSNHTERVKEYSKNISFVLDQTAPSITISGVDEGGIYDTDTRSVTVAYGENFAMDNLIITNGEKTETYTAEQLQATGGTLEFVVPASREKQSVKVTAADKAGNIATIESPRFVLSSSLFVRWVNNTPVMVGTISFGVLAVAAVADYLRKGFLFALLHKHTGVKH